MIYLFRNFRSTKEITPIELISSKDQIYNYNFEKNTAKNDNKEYSNISIGEIDPRAIIMLDQKGFSDSSMDNILDQNRPNRNVSSLHLNRSCIGKMIELSLLKF